MTNQVISRLVRRGEHDFITPLLYYISTAVFQYALAAHYLLRVTYFHVIFVFISLLVIILRDFRFLPARRLLARYLLSKCVCLSVTGRYCVETAKPILKLFDHLVAPSF